MVNSREKVLELFRAQEDFMHDRVNSGIENYRKGDCLIILTDKHGAPIKKANISVSHKKHEFKFGANLFALDQFETEEKNKKYREMFKEIFNIATLPFYWTSIEPQKGELRYEKGCSEIYRRPPIDLCIEYCEENGIEPREHALAYQTPFPKWLRGKSSFEIKKELRRRISEIADRYADKIPTMEVTNEMYWDMNDICFYKQDDYIPWCFKEVEKFMPNNQIAINEHGMIWYTGNGTNRDRYYMQIEDLLNKGIRIDAIGTQFHMFTKQEDEYAWTRKTYSPEFLYRVMDKYAEFSLPLQMTEITIPAYSGDKFDEDIQAEILKNLYSIWFSHKNMEQIIYWNFIDGYAAGERGDMTSGENKFYGGILRPDFSEKPAYKVLNKLINEEWRTNESLVTDDEGKACFRGFYGDYDIEIEVNGRLTHLSMSFSKKGDGHIEISI